MYKFAGSILAFMMLAISHSQMACADQNDPRLDRLFSDLQTPLSEAEVTDIEEKIWAYWINFSDDQTINDTMTMALKMMDAGRLQSAEQLLSSIIDREPNFAEAWNKRATVRFIIGKHGESAKDIAKVLQLEPRHFGALSGLGMIHMQAGNGQSALKSYEAAFAIHPYLRNIKTMIDELKQRLKGRAL